MSESAPAVFRVVINAPIERVWQELTNTNEVLPFFFNSRLDTNGLAPGGQIRRRSWRASHYRWAQGSRY